MSPEELLKRIGVLPSIARRAIEGHLAGVKTELQDPSLPAFPVFVTLRKRSGALRGCIGTLVATESDLVAETARSAVLAATNDPRFAELSASELRDCTIEVSVLMPIEPVNDIGLLDPHRYGIVVQDALGRRGVLLPNLEGIDTPAEQVATARRKAGIPPGADVSLSRFEVAKAREP